MRFWTVSNWHYMSFSRPSLWANKTWWTFFTNFWYFPDYWTDTENNCSLQTYRACMWYLKFLQVAPDGHSAHLQQVKIIPLRLDQLLYGHQLSLGCPLFSCCFLLFRLPFGLFWILCKPLLWHWTVIRETILWWKFCFHSEVFVSLSSEDTTDSSSVWNVSSSNWSFSVVPSFFSWSLSVIGSFLATFSTAPRGDRADEAGLGRASVREVGWGLLGTSMLEITVKNKHCLDKVLSCFK